MLLKYGKAMPNPVNNKKTRIENIKELVVPFAMIDINTTTNENVNMGKKANKYDNITCIKFGILPFRSKDAISDKTITKIRLTIIKLAIDIIFPRNTLSLEAGPVKVNLIVLSANSPANISILIKAVKSGKKE